MRYTFQTHHDGCDSECYPLAHASSKVNLYGYSAENHQHRQHRREQSAPATWQRSSGQSLPHGDKTQGAESTLHDTINGRFNERLRQQYPRRPRFQEKKKRFAARASRSKTRGDRLTSRSPSSPCSRCRISSGGSLPSSTTKAFVLDPQPS